MAPVDDMRPCPWCRDTLPADHDCTGSGSEMPPHSNPHQEATVPDIDDLGEPTTPLMEESDNEVELNLDEVLNAYEQAMDSSMVFTPASVRALDAVPVLLRELRSARERLASVVTSLEQFTVTEDADMVPTADAALVAADLARGAAGDGQAVWVRSVSFGPWVLTSESPF